MPARHALAIVVLLTLAVAPAEACLWDQDTLRMERRQFPDTLELITGKFLRHGQGFYRWRIADRERRLSEDPTQLALYDDLAVAYEKTGRTEKAIEIMLAKAERKPGVYGTEANLGTFYIHAGDHEQGLVHIRRAIEINPDAHFGREVYQQRLVEYVLTKRKDGVLELPMAKGSPELRGARGFGAFILAQRPRADGEAIRGADAEIQAAVKGVLGMMRFGNYDSPVLLEALGDLLMAGDAEARDYEGSARNLAGRAYLKASYGVDEAARASYRTLAKYALTMQTPDSGEARSVTLAEAEAAFKTELEVAQAWHAAVHADEERWIAQEEDVEVRFAETYYAPPSSDSEPAAKSRGGWSLQQAALGFVALVLLVSIALRLVGRRRRAQRLSRAQRRSARRSAR